MLQRYSLDLVFRRSSLLLRRHIHEEESNTMKRGISQSTLLMMMVRSTLHDPATRLAVSTQQYNQVYLPLSQPIISVLSVSLVSAFSIFKDLTTRSSLALPCQTTPPFLRAFQPSAPLLSYQESFSTYFTGKSIV